jgi:ribonuclease HI
MRCYFSSDKVGPPGQSGPGFVSFVIPELRITFRARCQGTAAECEYASLLALLEFVEINPKVFGGRTIEIFGDSFTVISQVNDRLLCRKELEQFRNVALVMKQRIPYTLSWIPAGENPAGVNCPPQS